MTATRPAAAPAVTGHGGPGPVHGVGNATVDVRQIDGAAAVVVTVAGVVGAREAAILHERLHAELDAAPAVLVVNLSRVRACGSACCRVLATAGQRARAEGVELHLLDLTHPAAWRASPARGGGLTDRAAARTHAPVDAGRPGRTVRPADDPAPGTSRGA